MTRRALLTRLWHWLFPRRIVIPKMAYPERLALHIGKATYPGTFRSAWRR